MHLIGCTFKLVRHASSASEVTTICYFLNQIDRIIIN